MSRRGLRLVPAALTALALAACGAPGDPARSAPTAAGRGGSPPVATAAAGTPPPTGFTIPTLPLPEPLPDDPFAPTPELVVGTLAIPALGITAPLQEGMTLTAINRGPSHWPGTAMPGQAGNVVVAGHRTTWSRPFEDLDRLAPGDRVVFTTGDGSHTYEVRGTIVVPARHIGIAAQTSAHTATLFACHPKGSVTERIVVKLRLLRPDGSPADRDEVLPPLALGGDPVTDTTLLVRGPGSSVIAQVADPFARADG